MRVFLYGFVATLLSLLCTQAAAEVFRCESPENGIVYQQTPCPEPEPDEPEEPETEASDAASPAAEKFLPASADDEEMSPERASPEVEACKQPYRDAIDAIDLEISNSYTPEQKDYYLGRLKELTEKMSAC